MRYVFLSATTTAAIAALPALAQCEYTSKRGFEPSVFIAQQGIPMAEDLQMYGKLRTDAFLIGGSVYAAGTPDESAYTLEDFLSRPDEDLAQALDNFVESRFPDVYQVAYDAATDHWYSYVPASEFEGLVIMDIEGVGLAAHPDNLLDHYRYTNLNGLTGHELVDTIMAQYGKCADVTARAFPGARIGLFGVVRGRRNGRSSEEFVRKVEFFKMKAKDPRNWLVNVDYLCPVVFSGWSPNDEVTSCSGSAPIRNCAARYEGMIDVALRALTYGPLVDYSSPDCNGSEWDPDTGCANVDPELWTELEPVYDAEGNAFRILPLLTLRIHNQASCDDEQYLVEPTVDPTLQSTLQVIAGYMDEILFNSPACLADSYAYWVDQEIDVHQVRETMTALAYPILGDFNDNGIVGPMDNHIFTLLFNAGNLRADLNGDRSLDRHDRCIMDNLLGSNCP